jgi:uncharacterized protein (DUF169 family)
METIMTNQQIQEIISTTLGITKEVVAIKVWRNEPKNIKKYEGKAFPGMCTQIGELLTTGKTFYTIHDQCFCTGGVIATGVAPPLSEEERNEMIAVHFEISRGYKDVETALYYEKELDKLKPEVNEKNAALQLGLLKDIADPDLALIFCNPEAADILSRTYCYIVGEPIQGFGGNGGCVFAIQYPYATKKPTFSYSDVAWRKYIGLAQDELTMSFPYQSLLKFIESLPMVAELYRNYGEMGG